MNDPLLQAIVDELVASHGAHTIVLYGSRADGSASAGSDYDIAAFAAIERTTRITRPVGDTFLDVFVYPEGQLDTTPVEFLKLVGGRVLVERDGAARQLLDRAVRLLEAGPEPLPPDERRALLDWARKMLVRMLRGDAEGHYRRAWLLTDLLPDYFQLRGLWYRGPKKSFAWLAENDPAAHAAFLAALTPGAQDEAIRTLVDAVLSGQTD